MTVEGGFPRPRTRSATRWRSGRLVRFPPAWLPRQARRQVRQPGCLSGELSVDLNGSSSSPGAAGAVPRGFLTTKDRRHEARLTGQRGCRPTTSLRVGGAAPSWLRIFVVKNRGLSRAAGPIVIAPQRSRLSDFIRHRTRAVRWRGYTLSAGGRRPGRTLTTMTEGSRPTRPNSASRACRVR